MRHWTVGVVFSGHVRLTIGNEIQNLTANDSFLVAPKKLHSLYVAPQSCLMVFCHTAPAYLTDFAPLYRVVCRRYDIQPASEIFYSLVEGAVNSHIPYQLALPYKPYGDSSILEQSVQAVAEQLLARPYAQWSIEQMAAHSGYSPWYFLRSFQKITGMTPHAFRMQCRIRLLRSLLRADTAAAQLAISTGFSDQSHMHKLFKRYHGITPKEFKQASFKLSL